MDSTGQPAVAAVDFGRIVHLVGYGNIRRNGMPRALSVHDGRLDQLDDDPRDPAPRLQLHHGSLTDAVALVMLVSELEPEFGVTTSAT
jgi:GDP-D-mannose dehydratase